MTTVDETPDEALDEAPDEVPDEVPDGLFDGRIDGSADVVSREIVDAFVMVQSNVWRLGHPVSIGHAVAVFVVWPGAAKPFARHVQAVYDRLIVVESS